MQITDLNHRHSNTNITYMDIYIWIGGSIESRGLRSLDTEPLKRNAILDRIPVLFTHAVCLFCLNVPHLSVSSFVTGVIHCRFSNGVNTETTRWLRHEAVDAAGKVHLFAWNLSLKYKRYIPVYFRYEERCYLLI